MLTVIKSFAFQLCASFVPLLGIYTSDRRSKRRLAKKTFTTLQSIGRPQSTVCAPNGNTHRKSVTDPNANPSCTATHWIRKLRLYRHMRAMYLALTDDDEGGSRYATPKYAVPCCTAPYVGCHIFATVATAPPGNRSRTKRACQKQRHNKMQSS